jgi:acyl carrier protein
MTKEISSSNFWQAVKKNVQLKRQTSPISPFPRGDNIPLSLTQEKLWFIEQLKPENSTLNMSINFRIQGLLNIPVLERTLREIVQRHEILRTSFILVNQQPTQKISPDLKVNLPIIDLQNLAVEQQEEEAKQLIKQLQNQPFNLSEISLWRLIKLNEQDYIFTFVIHHLIFDAWSLDIFRQEFKSLYQAFANNQPSPLPELSIQYADYTQWQRSWLIGEKLTKLENYWKQQFEGNISSLILPIDHPYNSLPSNEGARETITISSSLTKAFKLFSHQQGVSLFVTLFTAFNLLLNRYSLQEDLLVCTTVSGRNQNQLKKLIGYFNNILLFRTKVSKELTFKELLNQVSNKYLESLEYQDFPFHQLSEIPNLATTSLSCALFSFVNTPLKNQEITELKISPFNVETETADFDLFLFLREQNQQLEGNVRYKTSLFERETIGKLISNFENILEIIVTNPDILINDLAPFDWNKNCLTDWEVNQKQEFIAPRSESEAKLASIWQEVLQVTQVGINDNFFGLGGNSLLAMRVISRINRVFELQFPLKYLFEKPTIRELSDYLDSLLFLKLYQLPLNNSHNNNSYEVGEI